MRFLGGGASMTSYRRALTRMVVAVGLLLSTSGFRDTQTAEAAGALAVGNCGAYGLA
jgi:hypothetical protein